MKSTDLFNVMTAQYAEVALGASTDGSATVSAKLNMNRMVVSIAGATDGEIITVKTPLPFRLIGGSVLCTATESGGALTIKNTTTAVTDAVACAVDKASTAIGTIDDAQYQFNSGDDDFNIVASGGVSGIVITEFLPIQV